MSLERRVITECLQLYKEFPCLWDNRQVLYSNKEARDQAYDVLLEKYRQLQNDANIVDLKKRIENLRTSFRREHKKVLVAQQNGLEYLPQLWYYDLMTFLTEVMGFNRIETQTQENRDISMKIEFDEESSSSLKRLLEMPPQSRVKRRKISEIYIQDPDDEVHQEDIEEIQIGNDTEQAPTPIQNSDSETEAFGKTVGLQLKELNPMQKIYAEKLISDIIYNARLNRLTFHSNISNYEV